MTLTLLYSPFPTLEDARATSRELIGQKLVACCNILTACESHYVWEGEYTMASEVILVAKTTAQQLEKARELLTRLHPYECPAILSFEASANSPFAAFVAAQTR